MGLFNKINKIFLIILCFLTFYGTSDGAVQNKFTIVIDAGHGGHDGGAHGPYGDEKDVTLQVALKLGRILQEKPNIKIIYTRTTDVFIPLAKRAQIANDAHADLFISIHCNSAHSGASGTETWVLGSEENRKGDNFSVVTRENSVIYLEDNYEETYRGFNPDSPEDMISLTLIQDAHYDDSVYMAQLVEEAFVSDNRKSRGVKQSGFAVLWRTAMPSVLIETGFISNYTEGKYLCSNQGQEDIAHSIAYAFNRYKSKWDLKNNALKKPVEKPKEPEKPAKGEIFKVQFLASNNLYPPNAIQFRGLKEVLVIKQNNFYKYFYGSTNLNSKKEENLAKVKKLGFNTAFIVSFKEKDKKLFTIELFSSNKKYNPKNKIFKNIPNVIRIKTEGIKKYSYHTPSTNNYTTINALLKKVKNNGFKDAIIIIK